ncbi:hypothetical protein DBR43_30065 [Pedobacter sp. KBW06]|nr:hypothetical protein DBR43_30065 [Pedobacter sp. KBW06]
MLEYIKNSSIKGKDITRKYENNLLSFSSIYIFPSKVKWDDFFIPFYNYNLDITHSTNDFLGLGAATVLQQD